MSATCRSCNAPIIWAITPMGKRMPLDAIPAREGIMLLLDDGSCATSRERDAGTLTAAIVSRHHSHFATCPDADKHRRPR